MITIYSKPGCMPCKMTLKCLDRSGLDYQEIDVSQDDHAANEIAALGYSSVPVVVGPHDHWAGFRPERISGLSIADDNDALLNKSA